MSGDYIFPTPPLNKDMKKIPLLEKSLNLITKCRNKGEINLFTHMYLTAHFSGI